MTKNELMNAIVNGTEITAEMRECARHALDVDAAAKAARKAKVQEGPSKAETANLPLLEKLMEVITSPMTASAIGDLLEVSPQKGTAIGKLGVKLGKLEVQDVKVPGKGAAKAYGPIAE